MDFIVVLAKIEPKDGCQDSIIELSDDLIYESLLEEGNIEYQLLKPIEGDTLTFIEKWESLDSLKRHMASPHFLNFREESDEFVAEATIQIIGGEELSL